MSFWLTKYDFATIEDADYLIPGCTVSLDLQEL